MLFGGFFPPPPGQTSLVWFGHARPPQHSERHEPGILTTKSKLAYRGEPVGLAIVGAARLPPKKRAGDDAFAHVNLHASSL